MDWESTYRASPVVTSLYLLPEAFHVHKDTTTLEAPSRAGDSALDVFWAMYPGNQGTSADWMTDADAFSRALDSVRSEDALATCLSKTASGKMDCVSTDFPVPCTTIEEVQACMRNAGMPIDAASKLNDCMNNTLDNVGYQNVYSACVAPVMSQTYHVVQVNTKDQAMCGDYSSATIQDYFASVPGGYNTGKGYCVPALSADCLPTVPSTGCGGSCTTAGSSCTSTVLQSPEKSTCITNQAELVANANSGYDAYDCVVPPDNKCILHDLPPPYRVYCMPGRRPAMSYSCSSNNAEFTCT
jgi:hypothetical protein